ncbi:hypothetical protein ARMGADRAFT_1065987, partial [Armillaria gallica]
MSWLEGVLQSQLALRSRPNDDMACSAKLSTFFSDVIIFENSNNLNAVHCHVVLSVLAVAVKAIGVKTLCVANGLQISEFSGNFSSHERHDQVLQALMFSRSEALFEHQTAYAGAETRIGVSYQDPGEYLRNPDPKIPKIVLFCLDKHFANFVDLSGLDQGSANFRQFVWTNGS